MDRPSESDASQSQLGERISEFRSIRRMSLRDLGAAAETTPGFLSQLERGQTNASIGVLRRIASALGLTIADLFEEDSAAKPQLLRREARPELPTNAGARKFLLSQRPLRHLEVYAGEFEPGSSTGPEPYTHGDSQEILYVVAGEIVMELNGEAYAMREGDSIDYMSSSPHRLVNESSRPSEVLWIVSPPTSLKHIAAPKPSTKKANA
jgi:transcriptional regulator with XRE-family HTH domain